MFNVLVVLALVLAPVGSSAGCTDCHESVAFMYFATSQREDILARHSIATLRAQGGFEGTVLFATVCEDRHSSTNPAFSHVLLPQRYQTTALLQSHQGRIAAALRFTPARIRKVMLVGSGTYFTQSVVPLIEAFNQQQQDTADTELAGFLSGFQADTNVLASSIVGLDRISSSSCIRSLQVATANSFSVESEAIYAEHPSVPKSFEYSPTHALTVALPRECSPHFLESSMWRALRGSDVRNDVTLTRVVHLALPASGEDLGDDDDIASTPDVVSIDEIESFHTKLGLSESNVPRPAASACVAFGQHSVIDEALSTVNMETVHNMKQDQCAPHAVLAGYAKCATSTLHAWMLLHPELVVPWTKEPNYDFNSRSSSEGQSYLRGLYYGLHDPKTMVPGIQPWFTVDGSTHLAWNMTHVKNLRKFCPSTKMIILSCDPVKRLVSHWNYRRFVWEWDFLEGKNLNDVVSRQLAELPEWVHNGDLSKVDVNTLVDFELDGDDSQGVWNMVREGLYDISVAQVSTVFPESQLLLLRKEDMTANPVQTLRKIEYFLGLARCNYPPSGLSASRNVNRHRKEVLDPAVEAKLRELYAKWDTKS